MMFAGLSDPISSSYINSKVDKFIALAPVVYLANERSSMMRAFASKSGFIARVARTLGVYLFGAGKCIADKTYFKLTQFICQKAIPALCKNALSIN